jgi:hypothetical protein
MVEPGFLLPDRLNRLSTSQNFNMDMSLYSGSTDDYLVGLGASSSTESTTLPYPKCSSFYTFSPFDDLTLDHFTPSLTPDTSSTPHSIHEHGIPETPKWSPYQHEVDVGFYSGGGPNFSVHSAELGQNLDQTLDLWNPSMAYQDSATSASTTSLNGSATGLLAARPSCHCTLSCLRAGGGRACFCQNHFRQACSTCSSTIGKIRGKQAQTPISQHLASMRPGCVQAGSSEYTSPSAILLFIQARLSEYSQDTVTSRTLPPAPPQPGFTSSVYEPLSICQTTSPGSTDSGHASIFSPPTGSSTRASSVLDSRHSCSQSLFISVSSLSIHYSSISLETFLVIRLSRGIYDTNLVNSSKPFPSPR